MTLDPASPTGDNGPAQARQARRPGPPPDRIGRIPKRSDATPSPNSEHPPAPGRLVPDRTPRARAFGRRRYASGPLRTGPGRSATMPSPKVRLRFAKRGDLRLVSHHDLMRCLERMARRAELPLALSQGFNPRPKIAFALALALGIEGHHEVVEMELADPLEPAEVLRRLAAVSPPGLEWLEAEINAPGKPAQAREVAYELPVPADRLDALRDSLTAFLASERWPYTRHRAERTTEIDLRPFVLDAAVDPDGPIVRFRLQMTPGGSARPEEVVEALGLRDLMDRGAVLARTGMELAP